MKVALFVALGLIPAFALPALAAERPVPPPGFGQAGSAIVVQTRQPVRGAIAPSSVWADLKNDTRVAPGDTLKTGPDAAADLLLPSGSHVVLGQNTIVRFSELDTRVLAGRVHLLAAPHGETRVQAGDLRVSGTDADAVIEKVGGTWRIGVLSGSLRVMGANNRGVTVGAGKLLAFVGASPEVANLRRSTAQDMTLGFSFDERGARGPEAGVAVGGADNSPAMAGNRWVATGLSTLLPGTGQLYAGELPRGLVYLGLDFALLGAGFYAKSAGQNNLALGAAGGLLALNVLSPLDAYFFTRTAKPTASVSVSAAR